MINALVGPAPGCRGQDWGVGGEVRDEQGRHAGWSRVGHGLVTDWSRIGHGLVTDWSRIGHGLVTD